ncbi:PREDICTED: heparan sulfate glucosamine 3-O-sulfotransferase 2-like [Priapulus caudatus]|uniref:Heparan sulfate glucosamine 3-O-sulfotransferase 2-like n=1 Tax=Priapulus caudatus TaxID=37621 RepID=A0ABM1F5S6_PRICU|nr:PREDICTED: heparan sulfate glucosamine 3-O-sulfotransferase 2-like [Priapulus caudatus]
MWKNPADTIGLRNDKSLPEIWTTTIAIVAIAAFVTGLYAVGIVNVGIVNVQTPTRIRVVPFEKQQTTSPSAYSRRNETISRDLPRSCPPGRRRRLPDCIIVGAAKCGTYALLDYLSLNPLVVARRRIPIEINYFNVNYGRGVEWYARQMPCAADTEVVVEKSLYFGNASVPTLVADVTPDVRLLLVVCDPRTRSSTRAREP